MQRSTGIMLAAIVMAATTIAVLGGCALRNTRDDYMYSRSSEGLWDADYGLIDWNFPTSQNQPPLEGPKRLRPQRTAIGVPWATTDTWPYYSRGAATSNAKAGTASKSGEREASSASSGAAPAGGNH